MKMPITSSIAEEGATRALVPGSKFVVVKKLREVTKILATALLAWSLPPVIEVALFSATTQGTEMSRYDSASDF